MLNPKNNATAIVMRPIILSGKSGLSCQKSAEYSKTTSKQIDKRFTNQISRGSSENPWALSKNLEIELMWDKGLTTMIPNCTTPKSQSVSNTFKDKSLVIMGRNAIWKQSIQFQDTSETHHLPKLKPREAISSTGHYFIKSYISHAFTVVFGGAKQFFLYYLLFRFVHVKWAVSIGKLFS